MRRAILRGWLKGVGLTVGALIAVASVAAAGPSLEAGAIGGLRAEWHGDSGWAPLTFLLSAGLLGFTLPRHPSFRSGPTPTTGPPRPSAAATLANRLLTSREPVETEVTALFCDISDYTRIATALPPARLLALLNRYYAAVVEVVARHGGAIEKYIGDAVLAVWGAPEAHPDDADRAVRAALEIREALARLNAAGRLDPPLRVHIGLNSGWVAAGAIGCARYRQFAAVGDGTNIASRVCQLAEPGEVLIAQSTLDRLRRRVACEALPPCGVKGKAAPLRVYRLLDGGAAGP